jgi:uncharacterized membrane protein (DUF106 family)
MQTTLAPITGFLLAPPPYSTLGILGISLLLAVITSLVNKRLLDIPRLRKITAEVQSWSSEYFKAQRSKDTKALEKLNKKKEYIDKLRAEMMKQQFRPTLFFAVPLLVLFYVLNTFYGHALVAMLPFEPIAPFNAWAGHVAANGQCLLQGGTGGPCAPFYLWYLICSVTSYQVIQRLLGASLTAE